MNNGKLTVTNVAQSFDIKASTTITLRNIGENAISLGFGDLDSTFVFGEGIMLEVGETFTIASSDVKRGDGTFYAVTKNTANTSQSFLSYASDGGVAPVLLATPTPADLADDVEIDAIPQIEFSNEVDEGYSVFLFDEDQVLVPGVASVDGDTVLWTPTDDLENDTSYILVWSVTDVNGKKNSGMSTFTTVAE